MSGDNVPAAELKGGNKVKRFTATLNDGSFINVEASKMELEDNAIRVYDGNDLVAFVDTSAVISAHISERGGVNG